jgi:hypothetical protein
MQKHLLYEVEFLYAWYIHPALDHWYHVFTIYTWLSNIITTGLPSRYQRAHWAIHEQIRTQGDEGVVWGPWGPVEGRGRRQSECGIWDIFNDWFKWHDKLITKYVCFVCMHVCWFDPRLFNLLILVNCCCCCCCCCSQTFPITDRCSDSYPKYIFVVLFRIEK